MTAHGKRALVSGGAGLIGSHVADLLRREGWRVRVLDNLEPQTHRKGNQWIDLQLPLYRHLWCQAVPKFDQQKIAKVELAYLNLPRDDADPNTGLVRSPWQDEELTEADQVACEVILGIIAKRFTPITRPAPDYSEDLAAICLDNRYDHAAGDDEIKGGQP